MRRIYESRAVDRNDESPFQPNERDADTKPRAARTLPVGALSRRLLPESIRHRAIELSVSTPQSSYERGREIPFRVTMRNLLPIPVTVSTQSPLVWSWHVDGMREASAVSSEPPGRSGRFTFDRGERKTFTRTWSGLFRVSEAEWEEASRGEHTIGASINVERSTADVSDRTTIRLE
ncbi:MAG: hypothetical protein PPP58_06730 [Natronomonas sp.]